MKVRVFTLGCKVNQYESGQIIKKLVDRGIDAKEGLEFADVFILNTCAVTGEAEKKSRQAVSRARKFNKDCKILVVGCASQRDSEQFARLNNVTFVKGVAGKVDICEALSQVGVNVEQLPASFENHNGVFRTKTRQTVKIQEGCNNFCSYCLVPYLRGRSRSRDIDDILKEVSQFDSSVLEVVLTGIDLSSFGLDNGSSLIEAIEALSNFGFRVRLGSLEVGVVTDEFLSRASKVKNFCPHFHLSLQSGSDEVLKAMNRHYNTAQYLEKVEKIRKFFPECGITTDLIVGFPTETEENFAQSVEFVQKIQFADMHVFKYSVRYGTVAENLPQVDESVKAERVEKMTKVRDHLKERFLQSQMGSVQEVIFEENVSGVCVGHSRNFTKVFANEEIDAECGKKIEKVRVFKQHLDGVFGEIVR